MPLWIEWPGEHPSDALPASGVALESITVGGVASVLAASLGSLVHRGGSASPLTAVLDGPRGRVTLAAPPAAPVSA